MPKAVVNIQFSWSDYTGQPKTKVLLPARMKSDVYGFDVAGSKYDNRNALHPAL
jgi:hypothetical protein